MKKKLTVIFLACLTQTGFAQKDAVGYTISKNSINPGFMMLNIDPWNVLISPSRMTFAGQFGYKFYMKGIYLNAVGDLHYLDNLAETQLSGMEGTSVYAPQKSRSIEVSGGYFFRRTVNGREKFHLKSVGKTNYVTYINVDHVKFFGAEAGLRSGFSHIAYNYEDKDHPEDILITNYYNNATVPVKWNFSTYMQYTWAYLGISYGKIICTEANFEGYGLRKAKYMSRYYLHLILPVSSSFEDIYIVKAASGSSSQDLVYRYNLDNVPKSTLGFRLGFDFTKLGNGVGAGLEGGIMPGFKGMGNVYLSTKFGFIIGLKKP